MDISAHVFIIYTLKSLFLQSLIPTSLSIDASMHKITRKNHLNEKMLPHLS